MTRNCSSCGKPISKGRLKVLPATTVCVGCSTEEDRDFSEVEDGLESNEFLSTHDGEPGGG